MKGVLVIAALVFLTNGCAVNRMINPVDSKMKQAFVLSDVQPLLAANKSYFNFARYLRWEGLETFESLILCPLGLPKEGETKHCLQFYGGVKIDGSSSLDRQAKGDLRWVYVYTPSEQSAIRWHTVSGIISVYNMGGE